MKITYLNSASVLIQDGNSSILCDPWLVDGEFYGSWCIYPPCPIKPEELNSVDAIYISHIHPDHFSVKTLKRMNKNIPIYIHKFNYDKLKKNIENLGFNVVEIPHEENIKITNDLSLKILAADNCNPELCRQYFGCGLYEKTTGSTTIDSMSVITNGKQVVVNTNDSPFPLGIESAKKIKNYYKNIDFLLVGYSSANSYPQCFDLSEQEIQLGQKQVISKFLDWAKSYVELFEPKFFMPFAGKYVLGGKNFHLNNKRSIIDIEDALEHLNNSINNNISQGIILNQMSTFDISKGKSEQEYVPINKFERTKYSENVLSKLKYDFEDDDMPTLNDLTELIPNCLKNFNSKIRQLNFKTNTKILIGLPEKMYLLINVNEETFEIISEEKMKKIHNDYVIIETDFRLLFRIFKGPKFANWNTAEIGSHLHFKRSSNVYERGLFWCLNYFFAA